MLIKSIDYTKALQTSRRRRSGGQRGFASASVVTGSVDVDGSRASMAMIKAEVLGLDANQVRPSASDTDGIGYTDVTAGSRTTLATG